MNTYYFTFEVKMSHDNFNRLFDLEDKAERKGKVLPVWKSGRAWKKWMKKNLGIDMRLVRFSYTGHKNNQLTKDW